MAFKRSFGGRRFSRNKKNYVWQFAAVDGTVAVTAGNAGVATLAALTDTAQDVTLIRMRGLLAVNNQSAGFNEYWGAAGIIKVTDKDVSAGIGSMPLPWTEAGYDWIWHSYFYVTNNGTLVANHGEMIIDSKAMRRQDDKEAIVLVVENQSAVTIGFNYGVRMLYSAGRR